MQTLRKQLIESEANYLKSLIDKHEYTGPEQICIYYVKHDKKHKIRIYSEVLGEERLKLIKFVERPLTQEEKNLRLMKFISITFFFYMIVTLFYSVIAAFLGLDQKIVDLLFYIGNVVGLGCSIYILKSSFDLRNWIFLLVGIGTFFLNGYELTKFLSSYGDIFI